MAPAAEAQAEPEERDDKNIFEGKKQIFAKSHLWQKYWSDVEAYGVDQLNSPTETGRRTSTAR